MMTGGGAGRGQRRILWFVSLSLALLVALGALLTMTPIAPSVVSALHHASASPAPQHTAPCIGESCALGPGVRDVQLFVEPDVGAKPVTSAIAAATHSVWVEVYLLTDAPVIAALEDARRRGVDVRVMLDEHPYGFDVVSPQRTLQTLATAGIQAKFANSAYTYTHAKMLIIDGATLYILTANLSQSGLGGSSLGRNREFGVIDTHGEDVAEAVAIFQADWNRTQPMLHGANLVVSPVNSRAKITALIASAQTSLQIEDEEMYDTSSENALIAAARRGVSVRLILPGPADIEVADVARLKAGGVQLVYVSAPFIHAKVIVADGRLAFVGSENFSSTSLDENREVGLLLADTTALATITTTFERDWAVGDPA
jgi:phosphatidylserine/phosphatidylglycerophosphate/cardiolipin synthase-like enzyme